MWLIRPRKHPGVLSPADARRIPDCVTAIRSAQVVATHTGYPVKDVVRSRWRLMWMLERSGPIRVAANVDVIYAGRVVLYWFSLRCENGVWV